MPLLDLDKLAQEDESSDEEQEDSKGVDLSYKQYLKFLENES